MLQTVFIINSCNIKYIRVTELALFKSDTVVYFISACGALASTPSRLVDGTERFSVLNYVYSTIHWQYSTSASSQMINLKRLKLHQHES